MSNAVLKKRSEGEKKNYFLCAKDTLVGNSYSRLVEVTTHIIFNTHPQSLRNKDTGREREGAGDEREKEGEISCIFMSDGNLIATEIESPVLDRSDVARQEDRRS